MIFWQILQCFLATAIGIGSVILVGRVMWRISDVVGIALLGILMPAKPKPEPHPDGELRRV